MKKRAVLMIVLLLVFLGIGHPVRGEGQETPCLTWNISGPEYQAMAAELADGAQQVPYVSRITMDYTRMIQPADEWQIVLIAYCASDVAFETAYRDVMREVIRLYPARWGHYAPFIQ
jgi:hypothetical protein